MPVMVFRLDGVPDDEAKEVRELLTTHHIEFYETPGGKWGISLAAIWLRDESQLARAKQLIADYQALRSEKVKGEYARLKQAGKQETLIDRILQNPLQALIYLAIVLLVLYVSTKPFIDIG